MKFSIVIPAYNEEATVEKVVNLVRAVKYPGSYEIIMVDDCSVDQTAQKIKKIDGVVKIFNKKNRGKGYCLREGFKKASGDIILIQDADLEYKPQEHLRLISRINKGDCDVVYGSRFINPKHKPKYKLFYFGNLFLSLLTRVLYGKNITDVETCYKVFKKTVLSKISLTADRFDFEPEITCKLLNAGFKIVEVPISYKSRGYDEGKKIGIGDGVLAIYLLFKYRFFDSTQIL